MAKIKRRVFKYYRQMILTSMVILLVPLLLISLLGFITMRSRALDSLERQMELEMIRELDTLDQQFEVINSMVYESRRSKMYSHYYRENPPGSYIDVSDDLAGKQLYLPFCESIYYYSPADDIILGSAGKYPETFFSSDILEIDLAAVGKGVQEQSNLFTMRIEHGQTKHSGFAVIAPIKNYVLDSEEYSAALIFVILDRQMQESIDPVWLDEE